MRLAFDIESDGLLNKATKIHCIVCVDVDTFDVYRFRPHQIETGLHLMQTATQLIGHNIINFDIPCIQKLYPWFSVHEGVCYDTLVGSRLIFSDIAKYDHGAVRRWRLHNEGKPVGRGYILPPHLVGLHGLKAWGYRLDDHKGTYGEQEDAWDHYSEEMLDYCAQDTLLTAKLFIRQESKQYSEAALSLEHEAAWVLAKMERNGFKFNEKLARRVLRRLQTIRYNLEQDLVTTFGHWYKQGKVQVPKKTLNYKDPLRADRTEGAPFSTVTYTQFKPSSRQHIAKVLTDRGIVFNEFTDGGQPKISDETLAKFNIPEAKQLTTYLMIQKRLGQIVEGKNAWLNYVTPEGFIHGSINPNGAVTGRATHSAPNIAQVPSGRSRFGRICRSMFTVPYGWRLVGSDASGLELRCLAHFIAPFDGGEYARIVLDGDVHWANTLALGLIPKGTIRDKHNPAHEYARGLAKTWIYSFLYGGGLELLGENVGGMSDEEKLKWKDSKKFKQVWNNLKNRGEIPTPERVFNTIKGQQVKKKFLDATPALKKLIEAVKDKATANGYLTGIDGRRMLVRSAHSAFNLVLQGSGAVICKQWVVEIDRLMKQRGFVSGWDGDYAFCAWVHDEVQVAVRTDEAEKALHEVCKEAMTLVQEKYKWRLRLDVDVDTGITWKETH